MDLIHTHWTLTIGPWTVLYTSKRGPVLNVFLCYLRSPGHNRKTRMSSFRCVSLFPLLFTHTRPRFQVFTNTHTHTPQQINKQTNNGDIDSTGIGMHPPFCLFVCCKFAPFRLFVCLFFHPLLAYRVCYRGMLHIGVLKGCLLPSTSDLQPVLQICRCTF